MKDAIYIPAYSDGLMGVLEKTDKQIQKEYQPDFNEKKSLRIFNDKKDTYFSNNYILLSAGTQYKKKNLRKSIKAENAKVFIDSGGYQLAHGTVDPKKYTDKIALEWSEKNGDIFPILDRPSFTLHLKNDDGTPKSPYKDYQECLDLSVTSAKYYKENKSEGTTCLNVIQGQTLPQIEKWYKEISKYQLNGWAYGGSKGNLGRIIPVIQFLIQHDEFVRDDCKYFHIFGVTSNESMIYFQYIQMLFNKHNIDVQLTYDSTSWNRGSVYGSYMLRAKYIVGCGMEAMNWTNKIDYKKMSDEFKLPCHCPICKDLDNVYGFFNNYEIKDLVAPFQGPGVEIIKFKKFNTNVAFHNLYLQLEYLDNVTNMLKSGMTDIYEEFFPKRIYNNLLFLDKVFDNPNKDWSNELNARFLVKQYNKIRKDEIKDNVAGESSLDSFF